MSSNSGDIKIIDGSQGEGGGQVLRISSALCAILGLPIKIINIRAGRSKPGLRPQHLTGLELIRDLTNGKLEGGTIGSTEITFTPGQINGGNYTVDTKTAGSITLIIQAVLPCLLFAANKSVLKIKGGTNVDMAPPIDYLIKVFSSFAAKFGINFNCNLLKRGFYPKGGGEIELTVAPIKSLTCAVLDQPQRLKSVRGVSFVSGTIPIRVADEMSNSATQKLQSVLGNIPVKINRVKDDKAFGNGTAINLVAETDAGMVLGSGGLGRPGHPASKIGLSAAEELIDSCSRHVCLDQWAQDQVILFMALAEGRSRVLVGPLTLHTRTAIGVTSMITEVQFSIIDLKTQPESFIVECVGMGMANQLI